MNIDEAYELTMESVTELERMGIKVKRIPSRSRNNQKTIAKYNCLGVLAPDKWFHVQFYWDTEDQRLAIYQKAKELNLSGICFDTGGSFGSRDWELDWSFRVKDLHDGDKEISMKEVEDIIVTEIENGEA
jgi:hypothetical protein